MYVTIVALVTIYLLAYTRIFPYAWQGRKVKRFVTLNDNEWKMATQSDTSATILPLFSAKLGYLRMG